MKAWGGQRVERIGVEKVALELELPSATVSFVLEADTQPNRALRRHIRDFRVKTEGAGRRQSVGKEGRAIMSEYAEGKRDFSGGTFACADLHGVWMPDASFAHADFTKANITDAWLLNCDFTMAAMEQAQLDGANLTLSTLTGALLSSASLREGGLVMALLTHATLDGANLAKACLVGADLRGAKLQGATLDGADLYYADMGEAYVDGARFTGARLEGARLPAEMVIQQGDADGRKAKNYRERGGGQSGNASPERRHQGEGR